MSEASANHVVSISDLNGSETTTTTAASHDDDGALHPWVGSGVHLLSETPDRPEHTPSPSDLDQQLIAAAMEDAENLPRDLIQRLTEMHREEGTLYELNHRFNVTSGVHARAFLITLADGTQVLVVLEIVPAGLFSPGRFRYAGVAPMVADPQRVMKGAMDLYGRRAAETRATLRGIDYFTGFMPVFSNFRDILGASIGQDIFRVDKQFPFDDQQLTKDERLYAAQFAILPGPSKRNAELTGEALKRLRRAVIDEAPDVQRMQLLRQIEIRRQLQELNAPGGLDSFSRASEFGIQSYRDLRMVTSGTGLEAHHLIEKRFADILGVDPNSMKAIALTPAEHQRFTNQRRQLIPYGDGTSTATREQIMDAAREIYNNYPSILGALGL